MSKLIIKYLSKMEINTIKTLQNSISNSLINVTCMGLYNHGKSSLLNVLIKDFEEKTFKTADVRETRSNKSFYFKGINYIDTPGLNAREHDDKRVLDAAIESDINIFLHTITTGEFVEKEIEFLNKIKNNWQNPKEFVERTIFVLSRVDKANNQEDILNTIQKMQLQIKEIFNSEALIIPVSAMRYKKGNIERKNILIKKSNVELLENSIIELKEKLLDSILKTRKIRLQNNCDKLIMKFKSRREEKEFELSKQKQAKNKFLTSLNQDISSIETTLKNMYKRLGE